MVLPEAEAALFGSLFDVGMTFLAEIDRAKNPREECYIGPPG